MLLSPIVVPGHTFAKSDLAAIPGSCQTVSDWRLRQLTLTEGRSFVLIFLNEIGFFHPIAARPGIAVIGPLMIFGMDKRAPFQYSLYQRLT